MGNWWLDEAPWPGPDENLLTWEEIIEHYKRILRGASGAFTVIWNGYTTAITAAFDEVDRVTKSATEAISGIPTPPDRSDQRAYALWAKQNRSVGPRSGWHFERDGRKVH